MKKLLASLLALLGIATPMSAAAPTTLPHPEWSRNAVIYEVNLRQYTPEGTINAFAGHLPRLRDLGVDILWLMPVHPISELNRKGDLGSYYAVRDYKAVNPEFGTLDDLRSLVDKAHAMGMKVIIDWVPNHTGCDNEWTVTHPDRYARNSEGRMFGPFDWTDTYKLDYSNPDTREAMIDAMSFWLREADIDGFRCDVAAEVPVDFWNEARPRLEAVKPGIFMLAEASVPALEEHAFDMAYNWPMKDLFNEIASTSGQRTYVDAGRTEPRRLAVRHAADIDSLLASQADAYPAGAMMMNMITNHDLNSWEGTEFERLGNLNRAFAVLSYTLPGMPLIYTGQETGMNRAFEFFRKDKSPAWEPRNGYFDFYSSLNSLKHNRRELAAGLREPNMTSYPLTSPDLYAFSRNDGASKTVVVVNLGAKAEPVRFAGAAPDITGAVDHFSGSPVAAFPAVLAPGGYVVYTIDR